jgi:GWxTD domain-containing protein
MEHKKKNIWMTVLAGIWIPMVYYSCTVSNNVSRNNLSGIYRTDELELHPEFFVYHINDTASQLYFKLNESELLFERKDPQDSFYANIKILCKVTQDYESSSILDSNSAVLSFRSSDNKKQEYAVGSIPLRLHTGATYLLTIISADLNGKKEVTNYVDVDKTSAGTGQNFLVRNPADGHLIFNNCFDSASPVVITCNRPATRLFIHYYYRNFPLAPPPFTDIENQPLLFTPDSSYIVNSSTGLFRLTLKRKGIYHISLDSISQEGITLFRYDKHFPSISKAGQMVSPLRYITSNDEYNKITGSENPKQAIDDFWLNVAGGSKERAKALIRNYYTRTADANILFTSYLEGWKTDRGMIYLIFGPPNVVYRYSSMETWTYGEERNYFNLSFTFLKIYNPFTNNDYQLQRSANFRNVWYNAVDAWREGRVY